MAISKPRLALKFFRLFFYKAVKRKWYLPGIPEITVDELAERMNSDNPPFIVDLRDKADFEGNGTSKYNRDGHIRGAQRIPITELSSFLSELPKDKMIVVICPGGGMSLTGAELLMKEGFDARSLKGGLWEYAKKGYPLVKSDVTVEFSHEETQVEGAETEQTKGSLPPKEFLGNVDFTVDARNLFCPRPILMSKKALNDLKNGQVLEILTTDPGSLRDIPSWITVTNQELLLTEERGPKDFRFIVRKLS